MELHFLPLLLLLLLSANLIFAQHECSQTRNQELAQEHEACLAAADTEFNSTMENSRGDETIAKDAICKSVAEKYVCFKPLEECSVPNKLIFLFGEYMYLVSNGDQFPDVEGFIASCQVFKDNEAELVTLRQHSEACSPREKDKARQQANMEQGFRCFADFSKLVQESPAASDGDVCEGKLRFNECVEPHLKCSVLFLTEKANLLQNAERTLRVTRPGFHLEKSCV